MTEQEFESAVKEFLGKGGKVQELPYHKPGMGTFISKGAVWSKTFARSRASGFASTDPLIK